MFLAIVHFKRVENVYKRIVPHVMTWRSEKSGGKHILPKMAKNGQKLLFISNGLKMFTRELCLVSWLEGLKIGCQLNNDARHLWFKMGNYPPACLSWKPYKRNLRLFCSRTGMSENLDEQTKEWPFARTTDTRRLNLQFLSQINIWDVDIKA